jgi:aspartate racemase
MSAHQPSRTPPAGPIERPGTTPPATLPAADATLHGLFEARARAQPDALAAREGGRALDYAQLDRDANRVADALLARGVAPEERVGVLAERGLEYLVAILGALKAGAAYLPLDPHQPDERIEYIRRDGGARVALVQRRLADRVSGDCLPIEIGVASDRRDSPRPPPGGGGERLAYVIYTSGSTGRPKGVMIEHRSVVNLVSFYRDYFGVVAADRFTQAQRPGFDGCVAEIWPALCSGASLHVPDAKTLMQPALLMQWLDREAITICDVPTVLAEALLDVDPPPTLRLRALVTGGDKLRRRPPAHFPCPLYDQYGPTESTVLATLARVEPEGAEGPLHVGRPIANQRVHLLDAAGRPLPPGEAGEIHLAGAGLARGYLGDPALTAERFVADPFSAEPGARLYRTGDFARMLPSGDLEYLGRADEQVKIRGFRVELGEIERRLAEHPAVLDALVQALPGEGGGKRLVAHYRTREGAEVPRQELRAFLAERLPNYMLPTRLVRVEEWPSTPNGKIDRRALAATLDSRDRGDGEPVPPRNDVDERLVAIWQETLGVRPIGIADDFFELGGQSLTAAAMASRVERELSVDLPLALLFQAPTIAEISDHVRGERTIATEPGLVPLATRGARPPLFVLPGVGGHVLAFRSLALAFGDLPCFGLQDPALESTRAPCESVEELAEHFLELLRTVDPRGPYRLLGYSLGGLVAYEMAQRLRKQGAPPAFVGLLDTPAPGYPPKLPLAERVAVHLRNVARLAPRERGAYLKERLANLRQRFRSGEQRQADYEHEIAGLVTPRMREVLAAHRRAGERYRVAPYAGPITLLRAEHPDWPATSFDDPQMGWAAFVSGEIEVRDVPGAHLEVLDATHAPALAAQLDAALERSASAARSRAER